MLYGRREERLLVAGLHQLLQPALGQLGWS
jgi:hypothetical protein